MSFLGHGIVMMPLPEILCECCVCHCVCVCVSVCGPLFMSARKRPWVFVFVCCVCVLSGPHL